MITVLTAVFVVLLVPCYGKPSNPIFELTDQNFDSDLKNKEVMIVDFYAPWCSDCARLKPDFEAAANDLARNKKFVFAQVDCFGKGKGICTRLGIRSWPQLKVFRFGQYAGEYSGYQDKRSIESFADNLLKQQWQPSPINPSLPQVQDQAQDSHGMSNAFTGNGWSFRQVSPCVYPCGK